MLRKQEKNQKKQALKRQKLVFYLKILVLTFVLLSFIKTFLLDIKKIEGNSMYPTLNSGQILLIFKAAYGIKHPIKNKYLIRWANPQKNDIVVFRKDGHFVTKRIAGNSLSPIEFYSSLDYNETKENTEKTAVYQMTVEDRLVNLSAVQFRNLGGFADKKKQTIPKNTVLVLGDNLEASYDSRDYGFVNIDGICAKVLLWK